MYEYKHYPQQQQQFLPTNKEKNIAITYDLQLFSCDCFKLGKSFDKSFGISPENASSLIFGVRAPEVAVANGQRRRTGSEFGVKVGDVFRRRKAWNERRRQMTMTQASPVHFLE